MYNEIFILLILLFVKHWIVDFVYQTQEEIKFKGVYGHSIGLGHSAKHGLGTAIVFFIIGFSIPYAIYMALLDALMHYHVDWAKTNYGEKDLSKKSFWAHFGLDQLAHYATYLFLVWWSL